MYRQMGHTDLIAEDSTQYIQIANKLMGDEIFRAAQYGAILQAFHHGFHKNGAAALEWLAFVSRVIA